MVEGALWICPARTSCKKNNNEDEQPYAQLEPNDARIESSQKAASEKSLGELREIDRKGASL
jgi:hypothetical protein